MKLKRLIALMGIAIGVVTFPGNTVRAMRIPRIELLRSVSVAGSQVFLSDLLPTGAPGSLRTLARDISLGATPQAGSSRILGRDTVERLVSVNQDVLSQLVVPNQIVVSRNVRLITPNEVFDVIQAALKHNAIPGAFTVQPADILLESQVFVGPGDCGLKVMRVDVDHGLRRARFLLWASRDPKVLPFFATARLQEYPPLAIARPALSLERTPNNRVTPAAAASEPAQDIIVAQGARARLLLRSDSVRIVVDVVSLEHGSLGQRIRVRMVDSTKIFNAQVSGPAQLEVNF